MKNKVCIVTGATAGIGKVTARELARQGATVVIVARDPARGEAALSEIRRESGSDAVSLMIADLASQASIRALAAAFLAQHDRLHVLVNNAGAILGERRVTEDGVEATFATNHLAYFLLTNLLRGALEKAAPARVVSVASAVQQGATLDFSDLQFERRPYVAMTAYAQSKLANVVWSAELARRLAGTGVTSNSLHPGVIASNFGASGPGWMRFGVKIVAPLLTSPEKGAATTIYLATSPEVATTTGLYFDAKKPKTPGREGRDASLGPRLWTVSEELTAKSATSAAA
jgi:NAD(P)-dependent dehydrogenase (short-subunit alcohol dehydrogenase family)